MRKFSTALTPGSVTVGRLTDDVVRHASATPDLVLFSRRLAGDWQDVTAGEFRCEVESLARGLIREGIRAGDRVALVSRTRYEWSLFDYALWWVGAVPVPVYENSSTDMLAWILSDSDAVACVVETTEHRLRLELVQSTLTNLQHVWTIDDGVVSELASTGKGLTAAELEERRAVVGPEDPATVIYTSGTTGQPKGCVLTHANFLFELGVAVHALHELFEANDASTLLFLPLPHVFARVIQVGCVRSGVRLGHSADMRSLAHDLAEFRPSFVLAVPRVFEMLFNAASQKAHGDGRGAAFDAAVATAIAYSRALERGRVRPGLRLRHSLHERRMYARLREVFGGRATYAVSGGAPLGPGLAHFFRGIGIPVLEGYGLTETTAAVTVNLPAAIRIGTVGRPIGGTAVAVAEDGELLVRGGQVFRGYWRDEQATREVLDDDGWLRTGDIGEIDDDGFVTIAGRKKEILVTAGGKRVAPSGLEDVVRTHSLVSHCLVVGEARPYVAALVTLDAAAFADWRQRHNKRGKASHLVQDPDLCSEIQQAVDEANAHVSSAESIRRFAILPDDWTEESGHVTPTLKLKRAAVMRDFAQAIERLYR